MFAMSCSQTPAKTVVSEPVPQPTHINTKSWEIDVPAGWELEATDPRLESLELFAKSPTMRGRMPAALAVSHIDFSDQKIDDDDFGDVITVMFSNNPDIKMISSTKVLVGTTKGGKIEFLTESQILISQLAVGSSGRGYIVRCGSDNLFAHGDTSECDVVLKTFKLK
jgi:hypothetical protein